jgi:hypothetical protein
MPPKSSSSAMARRAHRSNNKRPSPYRRKELTVNHQMSRFSSTHRFVAPIFRTKMLISFPCQLPASSAKKGYFAISGNSMHNPFASSLATTINTVNNIGFTPYNGEVYNTVQCAGYSAICSPTAPYSAYRVLGSKLKVDVTPSANSDQIIVVLGTVLTTQNSPTTIWTAIDAPNSSTPHTFSVYYKQPTLVKSARTSELFGVSDDAIRDVGQYSGLYATSPSNEWCWIVNYNTMDDAVTSATMGWIFRVEYDVEFYFPATGDVPDTLRLDADHHSKCEEPLSESVDVITIAGKRYAQI